MRTAWLHDGSRAGDRRTEIETVEETRKVYEHSMEILMGYGAKVEGAARAYDAGETYRTRRRLAQARRADLISLVES